ncbi:anthranilate synthase component I family protein [Streptomyces sp. NPDC056716]|uniref:anthranilate synthase component I family protein n=1 Tax=unclassified Streptomyces TaxID=2593676 RepID=UPI003699D25C
MTAVDQHHALRFPPCPGRTPHLPAGAQTVVRARLPGWRSPEEAALALGRDGDLVWMDAGHGARRGLSVLGWGSEVLAARATDHQRLAEALDRLRGTLRAPQRNSRPLGWYGWIGYGTAAATLAPADPEWAGRLADPERPDLCLLRVDRAIVFDHARRSAELVRCRSAGGGHDTGSWHEAVSGWWSGTRSPAPVPAQVTSAPARSGAVWADDDATYLRLIARCQDAIRDGDAYLLCLTTSAHVRGVTDDLETYRRLRRGSPAPRARFMRLGGTAVLSASPERFLTVAADGTVMTSPIKGTRPRGRTPKDDRRLAAELLASEKERAENVMIVDLMRNDLNKVCLPGSVEVTELFGVHSYPHVHQLVSTVRGSLRPGSGALDAFLACFPAGSMTGAPKRRAVELLSSWEAGPRGVYSGALGAFLLDGSADLAVVIRTIVMADGVARIGAGGGITSSSVPVEELAEVKTKAAALLAALGTR